MNEMKGRREYIIEDISQDLQQLDNNDLLSCGINEHSLKHEKI